ncbi:transposase [Streptomyces monashensis]|uniref:transposase n=1 Tax=Streptomyces monashensis TaxID=1678012 RepID=UPI0033F191D8
MAETGGDMAQFATAGLLTSWIGGRPGMSEAAGVTKSARTRNVTSNSNLKRLLGIAATSVARNKDCFLSSQTRRSDPQRARRHMTRKPVHSASPSAAGPSQQRPDHRTRSTRRVSIRKSRQSLAPPR